MQAAKTYLLMLICIFLLGACGLRGPLYLPDEKPAGTQPSDQSASGEEKPEEDEDDKKDKQQAGTGI